MKKQLRGGVLLLVLLMASAIFAQDEPEAEATAEADLPVIPYFRTNTFNVPILGNWTDNSAGSTAVFVNEALNANIRVEDTSISLTRDGIEEALQTRFGDSLPSEATFTNTVNLGDGAWVQMIYTLEDGTTISAFGNSRNDRTYVITFMEENPDANTYMLIVQREDMEDDASTSPENAVIQAIETLITDDFDHEALTVETLVVPNSTWEWTRYQYESESVGTITALGYIFGRATYTTISTKEDVDALTLAYGFATIHLGFFTTPDNSLYLLLGLAVTFATLGILIFSMMMRWRGARQDLALIEQLHETE